MAMKIVYDLKIIVDHTLKAPFSAKKYLIVEYLIVEIYCIQKVGSSNKTLAINNSHPWKLLEQY